MEGDEFLDIYDYGANVEVTLASIFALVLGWRTFAALLHVLRLRWRSRPVGWYGSCDRLSKSGTVS